MKLARIQLLFLHAVAAIDDYCRQIHFAVSTRHLFRSRVTASQEIGSKGSRRHLKLPCNGETVLLPAPTAEPGHEST